MSLGNPLNVLTRFIGFSTGWARVPETAVKTSSIAVFDVRLMAAKISESGGEASDGANLGTVHYTYDDMAKNDGKVTLPYG